MPLLFWADCPGFLVLCAGDARLPSLVQEPQSSREGNPPPKTTHPNKNSCTNSLRKLSLPVFCLFSRNKGGTICTNCSGNDLHKLCFYFGGCFFGGSPLHEECLPGLALATWPLRANSWTLFPPASLPPVQKRDTQHNPVLFFLGFGIFLDNFEARNFLGYFGVFSFYLPRILWVRQGQKILHWICTFGAPRFTVHACKGWDAQVFATQGGTHRIIGSAFLGRLRFSVHTRKGWVLARFLEGFLEGSLKEVFLRRVLRRRLVRVSMETEVLRRVLRTGGGVIEGA